MEYKLKPGRKRGKRVESTLGDEKRLLRLFRVDVRRLARYPRLTARKKKNAVRGLEKPCRTGGSTNQPTLVGVGVRLLAKPLGVNYVSFYTPLAADGGGRPLPIPGGNARRRPRNPRRGGRADRELRLHDV